MPARPKSAELIAADATSALAAWVTARDLLVDAPVPAGDPRCTVTAHRPASGGDIPRQVRLACDRDQDAFDAPYGAPAPATVSASEPLANMPPRDPLVLLTTFLPNGTSFLPIQPIPLPGLVGQRPRQPAVRQAVVGKTGESGNPR